MNKLNVLLVDKDPLGACSWYRSFGPLSGLRRTTDITVTYCPKPDWPQIHMADVVWLERPWTPEELQVAELANAMGKKLIVDFDDDIFAIPVHNEHAEYFNRIDTQKNIRSILSLAAHVVVTTQHLQRKVEQVTKIKATVIPNAHDDYVLRSEFVQKDREHKFLVWRGSETHKEDLRRHADTLIKMHEKYTDWVWIFWGYHPYFLTKHIKDRWAYFKPKSMPVYLTQLKKMNPNLLLVLLNDDEDFNRAKSNCAALEGTYAGAAVLAPDMEEWRRPGISTYIETRLEEELSRMLSLSGDELMLHRQHTWEWMQKHRMLSTVNQDRVKLLHE